MSSDLEPDSEPAESSAVGIFSSNDLSADVFSAYAATLTHERLAELVIGQLDKDWRLRARINAEARGLRGEGIDLAEWLAGVFPVPAPARRYAAAMGLLRRDGPRAGVPARARVVPGSLARSGTSEDGHNTAVVRFERMKVFASCVLTSVSDGQPFPTEPQDIQCRLPVWAEYVIDAVGTDEELTAELPASIELPVVVDPVTRRITSVSVDELLVELEPYRRIGVQEFKENEGLLHPVRGFGKASRRVKQLTKDTMATWTSEARKFGADVKDPVAANERPVDPKELEQSRRTATNLRQQFEQNPKMRAKVRASVLQAGPDMADGVRGGIRSRHEFEMWLEFQAVSGVVTSDEAAELSRRSGLTE